MVLVALVVALPPNCVRLNVTVLISFPLVGTV